VSSLPRKKTSELADALKAFRNSFFTVGVFSLFVNVLMLVPSIYMMQVYDRVLASGNQTTLLMITLLLMGLFVLMGLLEMIRSFVLVRVGARLDLKMNPRVFTAAFERNLVQPGSNTAQSLHDLSTLRSTFGGNALVALFDTPWLPIYLWVIYAFSTELGHFTLGGAILLAILAVVNERVSKPLLDSAQKIGSQSNNMAANNLRNAEVIEAMGMLPQIRRRWTELHTRYLREQTVASDRAAMMASATKVVRMAMQSLVLGYGALLTIDGKMTAGMMIAASILTGRALAPMELLIGNWKQLITGRAAYQRLTELLTAFPPRRTGMKLPAPRGDLAFEGVMATAPGSRVAILSGVSFAIAAGEMVAVIGPSASGKSTLSRLIVGVWPAVQGSVRLDGADVYSWSKDELGPYVGYLPQDIELFDGTVAENIARFGELDPQKVVAAAQMAGMHDLILQMPKGYDTPLGSGGSSLSGGQRQRVGLARALYGNPSLIVLDEPNSNLDEAGEVALAETLRNVKAQGKTIVLVTHRMSTLSVCDKILLLVEGQVKAFGPRDQVLAALSQQRRGPGAAGPGAAGAGGPGAPGGSGAAAAPGAGPAAPQTAGAAPRPAPAAAHATSFAVPAGPGIVSGGMTTLVAPASPLPPASATGKA
jgi:ATP-binding cassette subfamily C exporter for protease/lipase